MSRVPSHKFELPFRSVSLSDIKKMKGSAIVSVSRSAVNYRLIELMGINDTNSQLLIDELHKVTTSMVDSERSKRNTSRFEISASKVNKIFGSMKEIPRNSFLVKR